MFTFQINQQAKFPFASKGSDGTSRPCGFSVQTSDYAVAYVALDGSNWVHIVPKTVGTVSVTISGHSQDGTPMTPLTLDFTVTPIPVPQADHFTTPDPTIDSLIIVPTDPGTDTVTGTL